MSIFDSLDAWKNFLKYIKTNSYVLLKNIAKHTFIFFHFHQCCWKVEHTQSNTWYLRERNMVLINSFILATYWDVVWTNTYRSSFCTGLMKWLTVQRRICMHKWNILSQDTQSVTLWLSVLYFCKAWVNSSTDQSQSTNTDKGWLTKCICNILLSTHHKDYSQRPADSQYVRDGRYGPNNNNIMIFQGISGIMIFMTFRQDTGKICYSFQEHTIVTNVVLLFAFKYSVKTKQILSLISSTTLICQF